MGDAKETPSVPVAGIDLRQLGERLRSMRESRGLLREQVCAQASTEWGAPVESGGVAAWERGQGVPDAAALAGYLRALAPALEELGYVLEPLQPAPSGQAWACRERLLVLAAALPEAEKEWALARAYRLIGPWLELARLEIELLEREALLGLPRSGSARVTGKPAGKVSAATEAP
jgi:transcriptional regulator with XRE-family HTH domain